MKTTIHYNIEHPEACKHALKDIQDYLGDHYLKVYSLFLENFNPCTWTMEYFHFFLGMYGIEGFPCQAFAWSIMTDWEASHARS